jgi:hypothetical protein
MTLHPTVEDVMLDPAHFQSAGLIDDQVPDRFGLYAIRTRDLAALPDPYRAIAEAPGEPDRLHRGVLQKH